jgi:hypothetical protein
MSKKDISYVNISINNEFVECDICYENKKKCQIIGRNVCKCKVNICIDCLIKTIKENNIYSCVYCNKKYDLNNCDEYFKNIYLDFDNYCISHLYNEKNSYIFSSINSSNKYKVYIDNKGKIISKCNTSLIEIDNKNVNINIKLMKKCFLIKINNEFFILFENRKCKINHLSNDKKSVLINFDTWNGKMILLITKISNKLQKSYNKISCYNTKIIQITKELKNIIDQLPNLN